jgi:hypothetical protein
MPRKESRLNPALEPITKALPTALAAAIGQVVARHAYLEWVLGQVMYDLMEISIKQGRVILKFPRPGQYIAAVRDLFDFHGLETTMSLEDLARKLDVADRTRNVLTRSTYMRDPDHRSVVVIARSTWDPGPGGETQPETEVVDGAFMERCRKNVDAAVDLAEKLRAMTDDLLRQLHERRRTLPRLDRRQR